jgi:RHS repeat-associated protein
VAALLAAHLTAPGVAAGGPFEDQLVQPPALPAPERASIAGSLSGLAFEGAQLARGAFQIPLPIAAPEERGALLARPWPRYSPDGGLTEWGQGWAATGLELRRYRPLGEPDFATDPLIGPWGVLARGADGAYYPTGADKSVRVTVDGGGLRAVTGDGTIYEFAAADAVTTPRGTFAWRLSVVRAVTGERAELVYERNASGRPFLSRVAYGGRAGPRQYRIDLVYELLATPVRDYRAGVRLDLDRRVQEVRFSALGAAGYEHARTYVLTYEDGATGPGFALTAIDRVHRSGIYEPIAQYRYDRESAWVAASPLAPIPGLDAYLTATGTGGLLPSVVTPIDADDDGLLDFEHHADHALYRQTAAGAFVREPLGPAPPGADPVCRPAPAAAHPPRRLARMSPTDAAPSVVAVRLDGAQTAVHVCDRDGRRRERRTLAGAWQLDARTRLVDLDRDGRPDLVRASIGSYQVAANRPAAWEPQPAVALTPQVAVIAAWVHDLNGDGLVDLVAQYATGIAIWYGTGQLRFDPVGHLPPFFLANGAGFAAFAGRSLSFVDANQDGATDVVVSTPTSTLLFMNRGSELRQVALPTIPAGSAYPLALELSGSGEHELAIVAGAHASALRLTRPSTGLLVVADDRRGTAVTFAYARASAAPGLRARPVVLASHEVRTAGVSPTAHAYEYHAPVVHSLGRFLVGFEGVTRTGPDGIVTAALHNDDDFSGLLRERRATDPADPLERFSRTTYAEVAVHGLRHLRPAVREEGTSGPGGADPVATRTEYLAHARGTCPTRIRRTSLHGVLDTQRALASVAAIPDPLHCLLASEQLTGTHPDSSLDFTYAVEHRRDALGQLTELAALAPSGRSVLQALRYDAAARLIEVAVPGRGATSVAYVGDTSLVARVIGPDGVAHEAIARDPVTDLPLAQRTDRGGGVAHGAYFRYDPLERLEREWSDLAGTESAPQRSYTYRYATESGALAQRGTVARLGADAARHDLELLSGDGAPAALLRRIPAGWRIAQLEERRPTERQRRQLRAAPLAAAAPEGPLALADLLGGATELARVHEVAAQSGTARTTVLARGVTRHEHAARVVSATGVVTVHREGAVEDGIERLEGHDDEQRLLWRVDEAGETTRLTYDALGRLARIELPDGGVQRERFDALGRTARLERAGIGARVYTYDAHGRLARVAVEDRAGAVERTLDIERDAIGRPVRERHALAQSGELREIQFAYDGQVAAGAPPLAGQRGRLTRASAASWEELHTYRADGLVASTTLTLHGWRSVRREYTYWDDGAVAAETWIVRDAAGRELERVHREDRYDAQGRIASVLVNGRVIARLDYAADGELAAAALATGDRVAFAYDAVTRGLAGHALTSPTRGEATSWTWNARGQIAAEAHTAGGATRTRSYAYDPRGYLTGADDGIEAAAYEYDAAGLPSAAVDLAGARALTRTGDVLDAGPRRYTFDALGRVVDADGLALRYGPDGHLASARRGGAGWSFDYDAQGRRLVKRRNGAPIEAYVGGATLTADGLIVPYRVGGKVVGALQGGELRTVLADARGTVIRDVAGAISYATPYGVRAARPAQAAALDYAAAGYDADLGTVRLGVRDFDPFLGRFLTPDPAMLDSLAACAGSTVDCSLYAYARNDPMRFVDPSGMTPDPEDLGTLASTPPLEESQCVAPPVGTPLTAARDFDVGAAGPVLMRAGALPDALVRFAASLRLDAFVLAGVSVDPAGPLPVKPEGELVGILGASLHDGPYAAGIMAAGVKAGVDLNYVEAMRGIEVSTAGPPTAISLQEVGVGVGGKGLFLGKYQTAHDGGSYVGLSLGALGGHAFVGIGGSMGLGPRTSPPERLFPMLPAEGLGLGL